MLITSSTPLTGEPNFDGPNGSGGAGNSNGSSNGWVASLAYRSRAKKPQTDRELAVLVQASQQRNRERSITGQLIYEDQRFFQWIEGPGDQLKDLWEAIKRDPRHTDIEVLGNQQIPARFFGDWNLLLATKFEGPQNAKSSAKVDELLPDLIKNLVIPKLAAKHASKPKKILSTPAHPRVDELAKLLIAADASAALQLFNELHELVTDLPIFYSSVIEPAARKLGDAWQTGECSEFTLSIALCRLQTAIRSIGSLSPWQTSGDAGLRAVLVAPQPGELHMLGAVLDDDVLLRAGWQTQLELPSNDNAIEKLVSETWFDALDLNLSMVFSREHWLPRLTETIAKARIASCNPELVVVVGGRVFYEQPGLEKAVGADGAIATSANVGSLIMRELMATTKNVRH
jgi:Sensors of blue-light using FAD